VTLVSRDALAELEHRIGVAFSDPSLLRRAMCHRSWCAENDEPGSNERLEFLGDSVLGLVISDFVFRSFPDLPEGSLSEVRAGVVNAEVLAELAREISLGRYLLLGKGEDAAGGREKQSILADALEALIAAVYLDAGLDTARRLIVDWLGDRIEHVSRGPGRDFKTRLQELAAQRRLGRPRYEVRGEGPDHAKRFYATVYLDGAPLGRGEGRSKKQAEQAAAWAAHRALAGPTEGGDDAGLA
jgi:ribonuclease-3